MADYAVAADRPVRLVTLTDARPPAAGAGPRRQPSSRGPDCSATGERVAAFAVSVEAPKGPARRPIGDVVAHLVTDPEALALAGAELAVGNGWFGLRSHPRPGGSVTFGGPEIPDWLDGTLRSIVGEEAR